MIQKADIEKLAELARITLSPEETEGLQKDISSILEYVGQVSAIVSTNAAPEVPRHHNVMRADSVRGEENHIAHKEEALRAAFPTRKGDFNSVRKIIQKDE